MVDLGPVAPDSEPAVRRFRCPLTGSGECFPEGCAREPSCEAFEAQRGSQRADGPVSDRASMPSGLVMGDQELTQGEVDAMQANFRAAGGWCAPSSMIYGTKIPEISLTGFIPDLSDVVDARHGDIFARWDEEDQWLREQWQLARTKIDEEAWLREITQRQNLDLPSEQGKRSGLVA